MIKEVKKNAKKEVKKKFLLDIFEELKQGKRPSKISKEYNISKQKLQYYLEILKKQKLIEKVGYGTWEVKKGVKHPITPKEVRGHAFIWTVKIPIIKNWEKRKKILESKKISYKGIGISKVPMVTINNKKILLGNKTITIYETRSFMAKTSIESRKLAIWGLFEVLDTLEKKFNVSFKIDNNYEFKVSREHYALIKNNLAIQCNKEGEKIYAYDKDGLWFCIDNSYNLDEAETMGKKAMLNNIGVQNYFNSHKKTNFKVTPEFILNGFNELTKDRKESSLLMAEYNRNLRLHTKVQEEQLKTQKAIQRYLGMKEKNDKKLKLGNQSTLNNF